MDYSNKSWMQAPPPVSEDKIIAEYEADVVVLGAGYAGTAAAKAAAEAGASVIVVEQQMEERFDVYGAQYGSVNSKFMQAKGIPYVDPVDIIADWQRRSLNRAHPELVRQFAYTTGDTFDWFIEPLPQKIKDNIMVFMDPKPKYFEGELNGYYNYVGTAIFKNTAMAEMSGPPHFMDMDDDHDGPPPMDGAPGEGPGGPGGPGEGPGGPGEGPGGGHEGGTPGLGGEAAQQFGNGRGGHLSLLEAVEFTHNLMKDMGVQFYWGITGEQLEKTDGRVTALLGRNYKKEYFRFKARKGVILAAGDFSGNKEMVMDLLGEYADLTGNGEKYAYSPAGRKGKGIQMGLWAGGVMEPGPRGGMWCCVGGSGGVMDGSAFLRLNKYGKRYTNEGIMGYWGAGLQGARQPKGSIYCVWDSNWAEELQYQTLDHTAVECGPEQLKMIEHQLKRVQKLGKVEQGMPGPGSKDAPKDYLVCADTLEELADKLELTGEVRENFLASIARYNELAHLGKDLDFAKDPRQLHPIEKGPFYCNVENNRKVGFLMVTVAGLNTDGDQNVLDKDDEPIPGLYATGNCCGNRFPIMYTTPVAGVSIGIAFTLGRIVGDHVAKK